MRSKCFHAALAQGNTRFQICQLVAKGVRITHKHGNRLEDSITHVMGMLKPAEVTTQTKRSAFDA